MKLRAGIALVLALMVAAAGCGRVEEPEPGPLPAAVELYFLHDTDCATCATEEEFYALLRERLGDSRELYPMEVIACNVFQTGGALRAQEALTQYGIAPEDVRYPALLVHGRLYEGWDSIEKNLPEAYLTAGEELFVNEYIYNPVTDGDKDLFDGLETPDDSKHAVVYFYRTVCQECSETTPLIDAMAGVQVAGKEVQIVRLNSRSGRNGLRIAAFFEAYDVADEDQMVPIVFLAEGYLAGREQIAGLEEALSGQTRPFRYPNADF